MFEQLFISRHCFLINLDFLQFHQIYQWEVLILVGYNNCRTWTRLGGGVLRVSSSLLWRTGCRLAGCTTHRDYTWSTRDKIQVPWSRGCVSNTAFTLFYIMLWSIHFQLNHFAIDGTILNNTNTLHIHRLLLDLIT